jgi:hypothetical protein
MFERQAAELSEAGFEPFSQRLETLGKAELDGLDIGVGEHEVVEQMRKRLLGERDTEVAQVGEVGLGTNAGVVHLSEHDLTVRAVERTPAGNMALERTELARLVALRMLATEFGEERVGLESGVAFEMGLYPGPVGLEGIGAGAIGARLPELAGEGAPSLVLAGGIGMHAGSRGSLFLGFALVAFTEHDLHLGVSLHWSPP